MTRFCAARQLTAPADLKEFRGTSGQWTFVPTESDEARYTFKRCAAGAAPKPTTAAARGAKRAADAEDEVPPAKSSARKKR